MKLRTIEEINEDATEAAIEGSIFLRIINFGLKHPDGFTYVEIMGSLKLEGWEKTTAQRYLDNAYKNNFNAPIPGRSTNLETPFFATSIDRNNDYQYQENKYIISFDAHFKYLDYQELKFARQNAREAKMLSLWAIRISILAVIVSAGVPLWIALGVNQSVRIDSRQLQYLKTGLDPSSSSTTTQVR